jgi:hypothetical protein
MASFVTSTAILSPVRNTAAFVPILLKFHRDQTDQSRPIFSVIATLSTRFGTREKRRDSMIVHETDSRQS